MAEKWSLLIGINDYQYPEVRKLLGCVNDVQLMARLLRDKFGFLDDSQHMTLLCDQQATAGAIRQAMANLAQRAGKDDPVVVHYAGHGSQMTDREHDEPSGMDSTIVPYDSGRRAPNPNNDISDDEIYLMLQALGQKTRYITLIFDSCHSGTITRDVFGDDSRSIEPDRRPATELPPSPIPAALQDQLRGASRDAAPSGWVATGENYVLLAGCRDDESSYEQTAEGQQHGALTWFLAQELRQATAGATYRDIFDAAAAKLTAAKPMQHPQLEGQRDRTLFGVTEVQPLQFVAINARSGDAVTLDAGAALGMTVGSQWEIYPAGTQRVTAGTASLGLVEITQVDALTAVAAIKSPLPADGIQAGCRALERQHAYGAMRLVVDIAPTPADCAAAARTLADLVQASDMLSLPEAGASGAAHFRAYIVPPRTAAGPSDPAPQLGAVREPTWAVVGRDGQLAMPVHLLSESGVAGILLDNLETLARYRNTLALTNQDPNSLLRGQVSFTLKRQNLQGAWEPVVTSETTQNPEFRAGDAIAFEILSHYSEPVYISVLDFGLTGRISLLFPPRRPSQLLMPNVSFELGTQPNRPIRLSVPQDLPPDRSFGLETLKLFVTTAPADFSWMTQAGTRDALVERDTSSPWARLFGTAQEGVRTRDTEVLDAEPDQDWTTVERAFVLKRA